MRRKMFVIPLCLGLVLQHPLLAASDAAASPIVYPVSELTHLQQGRPSADLRRQLSASQQAQILSDVQQHQPRFSVPQAQVPQNQNIQADSSNHRISGQTEPQQPTAAFPSLAKYKVDRAKQQQQQQLQQLQQQYLLQQQQKVNQQLGQNLFQTAQTQYNPESLKQQQQFQEAIAQQQYVNYPNAPNKFQNLQQDLSQSLLNGDQTLQLQSYFEKQRQLEALQRQRQQLILEQQELKRQRELLRLQQLQQLTLTTTAATTTSTTSTTPSPLLLSSPTARRITPAESDLFLKAIANHQKKFSTTPRPLMTTTTTTKAPVKTLRTRQPQVQEYTNRQDIPKDILSLIEAQESQRSSSTPQLGKSKPQIKIIYQTEEPPTARQKSAGRAKSSESATERDLLLKQLKLALAQSPDDDLEKNLTTRELILPDGKKVQVIRGPNSLSSLVPSDSPNSIQVVTEPTTTIRPPKAVLDELTKGVLPPGADFEVIRQKDDGKLEEVGKVPIQNLPAKKVTFVVLEEQPDGSYKVQGVKGNTEKESGGDLESIVQRIKSGELKLPPSSLNASPSVSTISIPTTAKTTTPTAQSSIISSVSPNTVPPTIRPTIRPTTIRPSTLPEYSRTDHQGLSSIDYSPRSSISSTAQTPSERYVSSASTPSSHIFNSFPTTPKPAAVQQTQTYSSVAPKYPGTTRNQFYPTMAPVSEIVTQYQTTVVPQTSSPFFSTTFTNPSSYAYYNSRPVTSSTPRTVTSQTSRSVTSPTPRSVSSTPRTNVIYEESYERSTTFTPTTTIGESVQEVQSSGENLNQILKREGLFAMAKFLRQSGLDTVLNETGPYTIFAPTDKAFRTLLVQLGGPEKAEQKFHDNPRLLSGLLLHHVIPGAFRIDSLQDEMTGVSLAGTQLRVNVYSMQDQQWDDVRVTTINGARVSSEKKDIEIPQGLAHAVDRVMFPLPVGDLVQTMQSDRERRFTTFLKALHASGLEDTLSGQKTFTVFAPTDEAFEAATSANGSPVWTEEVGGPEAAKALVSRYVIPTTLYTAGMRYYQQKDSLHQTPITIHKNGGRIKVNNSQVITHNIPATNGVIHAIDAIL